MALGASLKLCVIILVSTKITSLHGEEYLTVTNCFSNFKERSFFPYETIVLKPSCTSKEQYDLSLNYDWTYQIDDPSIILKDWLKLMPNKTIKLEVPPYGLPPKKYIVSVETKRKSFVLNGLSSILKIPTRCYLSVLPMPPVATLKGGSERMVAAGSNVVINAENSFDPNTLERSLSGLKFTWRCEQKKRPQTFCKEGVVSNASSLVIPGSHITINDEFFVKLQLSSKFSESSEVTQNITITEKAFFFEIRKNCHPIAPFPSVNKNTSFGIICHKHCDQIAPSEYVWSLKSESDPSLKFDFTKWPYKGRGHKFVIPANTIKWGLYKISVDVKSKGGWRGHSATVLPSNIQPPHVKTCKIEPNEGMAYETLFKFSCSEAAKSLYYEFVVQVVYDLSKEIVVLSGYAPEVMNNVFRLPKNERRRFFVRAMDKGKPQIEIEVFPKVSLNSENPSIKILLTAVLDFFNNKPDSELILDTTIKKFLAEDIEATSVLFEAIYQDLVILSASFDEPLKEFLLIFQETAVTNLLNDPIEELKTTLAIKNSIENLKTNNISARSDPLLAEYVMNLCFRMSQNSLERIAEQVFPLDYQEESLLIAEFLTNCLESSIDPNYETAIKLGEDETGNSTKPPVHYVEDYVDHDETYYQNLEKLVASTKSILRIGRVATKLVAFTTPVGEVVEVSGKTAHLAILKNIGSELFETTVEFKDLTIRSSPDLKNDLHSYDLMLVLWEKDITWWNPSNIKVCTSILSIEYWHSTCMERVIRFNQRADLFFPIKPEKLPQQKISSYSIDVPAEFSNMTKEKLNYEIQVHKIEFYARRKLEVYFHDISPGTVFDVVLLVNKFPTIEDFQRENTTIRNGTKVSFIERNDGNYNKFAYIGVLANKESTGDSRLTYKMSSVFTSCVKFFFVNISWTATCRPGDRGNSYVVHCRCRRFSMVAGHVENTFSQPQIVIQPHLELILDRNIVVFLTTMIILIIYLSLILLVLHLKQDEFFFLADNEANHRFAYLLSINTGTGWYSGTTANIIIKINGDKAESQPHVLNYPDPKLRLLQQFGHNMFVLATEHHLGLIKSIELWSDSIGEDPAWECREIIVYDLQLKRRWFFPVKQTLSLLLGTSYLVAYPSSKTISSTSFEAVHSQAGPKSFKEKVYSACKFTLSPRYHTWYLWQKEENYTFLKKLTVILSNVLSCCAVTLMLLGTPKFDLTDNFENEHKWKFRFTDLLAAFLSSFITFMVHISIAWSFRFSRPQLSFYNQIHKMPFRYTVFFLIIIIFFIVTSETYLVVCGFWLPFNKSLVWLTASLIGIVFGVIVYEGLFLSVQNLLCRFKTVLDISYKFTYIWNIIEIQRTYLYGKFGEQLLRPYFEHLYAPLAPIQIKKRFKILKNRVRVSSELSDLLFFGVYTILLYILILINRDPLLVNTKSTMKQMLEGHFTRTPDFRHIEDPHEITHYLNETFLQIMHPQEWYGNYHVNDSGLMLDMVKKTIGVARIRQHRMPKDVCNLPEVINFLNVSCSPEFSVNDAEMRTFGSDWSHFTSEVYKTRMWRSWQYSLEDSTKTWEYKGKIATYPGGGYVAFLGRSLHNSQANLRNLVGWLDHRSRAVFIEFLTYSMIHDVVNSVRLVFEHSASGYSVKSLQVLSAQILVYGENKSEMEAYIVILVFAIYSSLLLLKCLVILALHFRKYYKSFWMYFNIAVLILSLLYVAIFLIRAHLVNKYVQIMVLAKEDDFVPYFNLFIVEDVVSYAGAILLILSTVRIWKFLRYANYFLIFEKTLVNAANAVFCASLISLIFLIACASAVLLIAGNEFPEYHSFFSLLRLMITMRLEPAEVPFIKYFTFKDTIFFWVISILVSIISFDVVAALVCRSYTEAQIELSSEEKGTYTIYSYFQERSSYLSKFFKYKCGRIRGGDGTTVKVLPKADKLLYRKSIFISTNHMDSMIRILQCLIRNTNRAHRKFSDVDLKLMASIGRNYFRRMRSEVDVFFRGCVHGQKLQVVDEKVIDRIANISNLILQEEQPFGFEEEEDNPKFEECLKTINKKAETLHNCNLNLKLLLSTLNSAEDVLLEYEAKQREVTFLE